MVTLTAVSRSLTSHRMLTVALAAVLCHDDSASAFLEASKASPGQKRAQGQNRYPYYPHAMSVALFHRTLFLTKQPNEVRSIPVRLEPERRPRETLGGPHKEKRQSPTADMANEGTQCRPKRKDGNERLQKVRSRREAESKRIRRDTLGKLQRSD